MTGISAQFSAANASEISRLVRGRDRVLTSPFHPQTGNMRRLPEVVTPPRAILPAQEIYEAVKNL